MSNQGKQDGQKPGGYNEFNELHVIHCCWSFKYKAKEWREMRLQRKTKVRSQRTLNGLSRSLNFSISNRKAFKYGDIITSLFQECYLQDAVNLSGQLCSGY